MKRNALAVALTALSLAAGGPAWAQHNDDPRERGDDGASPRERQAERRDDVSRIPGRPSPGSRANDQRGDERRDERGAGPNHAFHRGGRLPAEYRARQYVVDDWRGQHLSEPPRGYHWVRTGADFVLVAIATGVILQLLLNN